MSFDSITLSVGFSVSSLLGRGVLLDGVLLLATTDSIGLVQFSRLQPVCNLTLSHFLSRGFKTLSSSA